MIDPELVRAVLELVLSAVSFGENFHVLLALFSKLGSFLDRIRKLGNSGHNKMDFKKPIENKTKAFLYNFFFEGIDKKDFPKDFY